MRLLLDAHISPAVARALRAHGIDIYALSEWRDGEYRHKDDDVILAATFADGRTIVTYDQRTYPAILTAMAAEGLSHAGVIYANARTIRQEDLGGLIRALRALVEAHGEEPWTDRTMYLRPA
jgi:predicted nuclease of predicted toxin-antitoxin system